AVWILDQAGNVIRGGAVCENQQQDRRGVICVEPNLSGKFLRSLPSGIEVWQAGDRNFFGARVQDFENGEPTGFTVATYRTSPGVLTRLAAIESQTQEYYQAKQDLRALKRQMLLILLFFTVLLLSAVMWVALFLA